MPRKASSGDTVAVHYTGRLEDGTVFDSSRDRGPIEFELGGGKVIPGFEKAVTGMEVGEQAETRVAPEDAYGARRQDLVIEVGRERLPREVEPQVGQELAVHDNQGRQHVARIAGVEGDSVTLDLNHPLAGKELHFELELMAIR